MSSNIEIAEQAERELNSYAAKTGSNNTSDTINESGVDKGVEDKFPGSHVIYGSAASGAGDNREIPAQEGGDQIRVANDETLKERPTKASDFEGVGGPEDKAAFRQDMYGGEDDVRNAVNN